MLEARDHLRAAAIALVFAVYGVAASPLPRSVKRAQFDTPYAREELTRWSDLFAAVGVVVTREELAAHAFATGSALAELRGALLGPARPWFRITGTGQAWGLFTYPDAWPHQLVIEVRAGGGWRTLYAGLDRDAAWNRDTLAYRRIRGVYDGNTTKPGRSYEQFVKWIAREALRDVPEADAVRVKFLRFHTRAPGEPADGERTEKFARVVER